MLASDGLPEQARDSPPPFTPARRHIPEMEMTTTDAREIKSKKQTSSKTGHDFIRVKENLP